MNDTFDLAAATDILLGLVADMEEHLEERKPDETFHLPSALNIRGLLNEANTILKRVREGYDDLIGDAMGEYRAVVEGHGQIERHRKITRRNWDSENLLRVVMDSRVVDGKTGEVMTQLDNIKAVYPLAGYQARTGALKARNIDPDEFSESEVLPGWKIQTH